MNKPYGTLEFTVASPQPDFDEPFTVEQAKTFLRSQTATDAEDLHIAELIAGARATAELEQGQDLVRKQWDYKLDYFCAPEIELRYPLVSVDLIRYKDSDGNEFDLTENVDYIVDTARALIRPPFGVTWPSFTAFPSSAVLIRFTSGFSKTHPFWNHWGKINKQGMRWLITEWYWNRIPFVVGSVEEVPYGVVKMLRLGAREKAL